jgi:hypothetical protein
VAILLLLWSSLRVKRIGRNFREAMECRYIYKEILDRIASS